MRAWVRLNRRRYGLSRSDINVHKAAAVRERIEACGCRLVFLPAYSPDFNPSEEAFSKLKTYLRRVKARTRERRFPDLTTLRARQYPQNRIFHPCTLFAFAILMESRSRLRSRSECLT